MGVNNMTCLQCDNNFDDQQYDQFHKMCNACLGKQRFIMEVEFEHPKLDFGVLISNTISRLMLEYKEAKDRGFHPDLGACPQIKILCIKDIIAGRFIDKEKAIKLFKEYK
jgi:hypothetical protein